MNEFLVEADDVRVVSIEFPKGHSGQVALVFENRALGVRLYHFLTREEAGELIGEIVAEMGLDT